MSRHTRMQGFTLVELAVVLVIIGTIIGGVLVGQNMIRNSQVMGIISDADKYQQAVSQFRDKYNSFPGDMPDAQEYWGIAHTNSVTCKTTSTGDFRTCNGDGNGEVGRFTSTSGNTTTDYERYRFWQHLSNAELIDQGNFTGILGADTNDAVIGENVPQSTLKNAGFTAFHVAEQTSSGTRFYKGPYGLMLLFGGIDANENWQSVLSTQEAERIDRKVDDSFPAYGSILTQSGNANCVTSTTANSASYDFTNEAERACNLYFIISR